MQKGIEKIDWRDIPGYEGHYCANKLGQIKRLALINSVDPRMRKERLLRINRGNSADYLTVSLFKDGKSRLWPAHRLIALTFIDNPLNKPVVNHKDRNRQNNHVDNLEWCTHKENSQHAASMDRMHLNSMQVGLKAKVDGTEIIGFITSVEGGWVYIEPSPEPYPNNFWHYKNIELVK